LEQRQNNDAPAGIRKSPFSVIPAEAGIQSFQIAANSLDSGFHRSDDLLRRQQYLTRKKGLSPSK
jgi:hypothetical protein